MVMASRAGVHVAWGAESDGARPPGNAATVQELPQVTVIGTAPLPGFGLPLNMVPANVQTANSADLERAQTLGVADYLNRNFSGVNVSESAGQPLSAGHLLPRLHRLAPARAPRKGCRSTSTACASTNPSATR